MANSGASGGILTPSLDQQELLRTPVENENIDPAISASTSVVCGP